MLRISSAARSSFELLTTVAMFVASGTIAWTLIASAHGRPGPPRPTVSAKQKALPKEPIALTGAHLQGSQNAPVAVLEFADVQCPFCGRFEQETYPMILRDFVSKGTVSFGFKHLPIEAKHPSAFRAAAAIECSGNQGQFWPMLEELFKSPKALERGDLSAKAQKLGLDVTELNRCIDGEGAAKVKEDIVTARALSITGTPTFLFGTLTADHRLRVVRRQSGAIPPEAFRQMLDSLLKTATSATNDLR